MNKVLQYVMIAAKAGFASSGGLQTESLIRSGRAQLVLLAADASENTKKDILALCRRFHAPYLILSDREELGRACGRDLRSCVVLTDKGIAEAALKTEDAKRASEIKA